MNDNKAAVTRLARADPPTRELVQRIQTALAAEDLVLSALKTLLIELLEYLASEEGRTDANCRAVDSFFMLDHLWAERNLPVPFRNIFSDMSGALHDTVSAPEIAKDFDSTPEQLLKRAKELGTEPTPARDRG